jgi:hypothetical protein
VSSCLDNGRVSSARRLLNRFGSGDWTKRRTATLSLESVGSPVSRVGFGARIGLFRSSTAPDQAPGGLDLDETAENQAEFKDIGNQSHIQTPSWALSSTTNTSAVHFSVRSESPLSSPLSSPTRRGFEGERLAF